AWSSLPAAEAAEDAAQDPPADLVADRARGLLGHGFDHALATSGAEHRIPDGLGEAAAGLLFILGAAARLRRVRLLGEAFGLPGQDLERGFAIHRGVVLRTHRAAGAHALAFGPGDRAHAAARRRDQRLFHRHRRALALQGR